MYRQGVEIKELNKALTDEVATAATFQFDLAPTRWTSELLQAEATGHVEAPWVSGHPEADSVMAVVGDGQTLVAVRLSTVTDPPQVIELAIRPAGQGADLNLQAIPTLLSEAGGLAAKFLRLTGRIDAELAPWRSNTRGTGTRRSEVAYAALAARYVEMVNGGERHPAKRLAADLGMAPVTVSQRIRECRAAPLELLTESTHGAAGGMLTEKAKQLLARLAED